MIKLVKPLLLSTMIFSFLTAAQAPHAWTFQSEEDTSVSTGPKYENRKVIPSAYKWRLEDIYETEKEWEQDIKRVETLADRLAHMAGDIGKSAHHLKTSIDLYVDLNRKFETVYAFAKLSFHTDKSNAHFQQISGTADDLAVKLGEKISFFIPELQLIPEDKLNEFMQEPSLAGYKRWILDKVNRKDHTLSSQLEELLAKTEVLASAPENIYGMLTKDITFPAIKDETGQEAILTPANYSAFMKNPDREIRKNAYEAYYKTLEKFKDTFAQVLSSEVKKNVFYAGTRNYPSSIEASLEANHIPFEVYHNLIDTVHKHLPDLHRFLRMKQQAANLPTMQVYDLYAEFSAQTKSYIPFEKAQEIVKQGLSVLGPEYQELLDRAANERWIDVYHTPGKRTGAYQWGPYDTHPYILLNYQGSMEDVFTLAHEFGHAAHSYFSKQKQSYLTAAYPIFTAEVASTTNEALLFEEMYRKAKTTDEKISILSRRLEDYMGTLFLQTMFAEFEKTIHEKAEKGEALTAQVLNETYSSLLEKYFGQSVDVDHLASLGWARIPHFYRNFYVYQYATGFAAANTFARQITDEGDDAVKRYIDNFLAAGDSKDPIDVLKEAGIDMESPKVIEEALKGFTEALDELERLLKERGEGVKKKSA